MRKVLCGSLAAGALLLVAAALPAENAKDTASQDAASQDAALFDRLDADKDGQLTAAEIPAEKQRLFQRLLRSSDQDKSGGLSRAEFLAGVAERRTELPLEEKPTLDPANPSGLPNPEQFFQDLDKNKDGKITLDEVPEGGRDRFQLLLTRADKNDDNAISKEEMTNLVETANKQLKPAAGQGRDPRVMFQYLDTNGDGKVALDEVPGERQEGFEKMLKAFDKDGDGKLNEEEFVTGMRFVQARQGDKSESMPAKPAGADVKPADIKPGDVKPADAKPSSEAKPEESKASEAKSSEPGEAKTDKSANRKRLLRQLAGKGFDPDKMTQRIMLLDKNNDGKISREEAAGPVAEHFDVFDANKDGFVDKDEIHERLEQVQAKIEAAKAAAGRRRAKPAN